MLSSKEGCRNMESQRHEAKKRVRAEVKARRDGLGSECRACASAEIVRRVLELPEWQEAKAVLAYCAFGSEVSTDGILDAALAEGKRLALPRVEKSRRMLGLYWVCAPLEEQVCPGTWGILEPLSDRCGSAAMTDIDLVIAPGLAFDEKGGRLGYGGGYYDRLFRGMAAQGHSPAVVAVAFEAQIAEDLPRGPQDWPIGVVVTEARVIRADDQGAEE